MKLKKATDIFLAIEQELPLLAQVNGLVCAVSVQRKNPSDSSSPSLSALSERLMTGTISKEEIDAQFGVRLIPLTGQDELVDQSLVGLSLYQVVGTPARVKKVKVAAGMVDPALLSTEQLWGDWGAPITA